MRGATLGRLWSRYRFICEQWRELEEGGPEAERKRELERQAAQLRDRLLVNYSPLVKYVSGRVSARTSSAAEMDDMASWGIFGLMDAIETYDPGRAVKFETYAISKIKWAIFDELRRNDWVPRRVRTKAQEAERATTQLSQRLGRAPTEAEIAVEMGIELKDYQQFRGLYSRAQMTSLEARLDSEVGGGIQALIADRAAEDPQTGVDERAVKEQLIQSIGTLGERERRVVTFYFYQGLTLKEIGKALSLTEGRISQILSAALQKLRQSIGAEIRI